MSLLQDLTPEVATILANYNIQKDQIRLCTDTDIDNFGRYRRRWLVATDQEIFVLTEANPPTVDVHLRYEQIQEVRCQSTVGSGLLQTLVEGCWIDLLRYSNRMADRFGKVAKKLEQRLKGLPLVIHREDEVDPRRCSQCGLMLQFVGDTCPRCVSRGAVLTRMWQLMKPYRVAAMLVMLLLILGIGLDLVAPQLTRYLVDHILPGSKEAAIRFQQEPVVFRKHLIMLLEVVCVLAVVQSLRMGVNMLNGWLGSRIGTSITGQMRQRLFEHLQQLSVAYYDRQQVGSLVGRVAYDTEALHGFVNQLTGGFLFQLLMLVGVGVMMFTINIKLALFTLIPAPFVIGGSLIFWQYIYPRYYKFWDAGSKQAGILSGILSGIRVVKAFGQEHREIERFANASAYLTTCRRNVDYAVNTFNPLMGIVFQLGGWIVWFIGGRDVLAGMMSLGELIAFFGYLAMFYGPLGTLSQFTNWLTQFATQAHRIFEILDIPAEILDPSQPQHIQPIKGDILFEKVYFGYQRHSPVMQDINLHIPAGQMIGVVGKSGSGKTTLVNLLCRFYDVDEGAVKIDGVDIRRVPLAELRSQIGVVLQEPFLFRGSIWDNITYGKPDACFEKVVAASKAANCHDFIMRTAHGYDTWLGERGAGLSGGERQRISIARVLLTNPRILILDEATSNVDAESEAAIQEALAELIKGRTTIAIAHRLSTLRRAERIIVMDQGRIAEAGTHEELIAKDGIYARLLRIQGQKLIPTVEELSIDAQKQDRHLLPVLKRYHPRWLTPDDSVIHLGNLGALHVTVKDEAIYGGVFAVRCRPVQYADRYISLRYFDSQKQEVEIGLIDRLSDWPAACQELIYQSLTKRYLLHTITAIERIELIGGYLHFVVQTDLGPQEFMMRWQGDRAYNYGTRGKLLIDTEENRYLIADVEALPENERNLFMRFIYW